MISSLTDSFEAGIVSGIFCSVVTVANFCIHPKK